MGRQRGRTETPEENHGSRSRSQAAEGDKQAQGQGKNPPERQGEVVPRPRARRVPVFPGRAPDGPGTGGIVRPHPRHRRGDRAGRRRHRAPPGGRPADEGRRRIRGHLRLLRCRPDGRPEVLRELRGSGPRCGSATARRRRVPELRRSRGPGGALLRHVRSFPGTCLHCSNASSAGFACLACRASPAARRGFSARVSSVSSASSASGVSRAPTLLAGGTRRSGRTPVPRVRGPRRGRGSRVLWRVRGQALS